MKEAVEEKEAYILVAVGSGEAVETSLKELAELLDTAGGEALDTVTQDLPHPDPATYIGSGKAKELRWIMEEEGADGIVCDDELSPAQMKNLSDILDVKVIDRTILILAAKGRELYQHRGNEYVKIVSDAELAAKLTGNVFR